MITTGKKRKHNSTELHDKYPHLSRALNLLESQKIQERMMGYALVTTCFHLCPKEVKDFIRKKWDLEEVTKGIKKEFVEYCVKKFDN